MRRTRVYEGERRKEKGGRGGGRGGGGGAGGGRGEGGEKMGREQVGPPVTCVNLDGFFLLEKKKIIQLKIKIILKLS